MPLRIALIGPDEQDNLALQYLAAAVEVAGHTSHRVRFNKRQEIDAACARVLELAPDLVGIGIAFQCSVGDSLALVDRLRAVGYAGHVTCGGHVPTFCHRQLLADCPGLDTVVRHDGEQTLVGLADRLERGASFAGLHGLVWRDGSALVVEPPRPPERDLSKLPWPKRTASPMLVGGVPITFVLTARGCTGSCAYCCIRAFGHDAGGPPFRMRDLDDVANEVADLYRRQRVRLFFAQDDLFILPSERKTLERLEALKQRLDARGVTDAAFWIKSRPESITRPVVEAARDLGAIHVFLGIENAAAERLAYLGRTHLPEDNQRAIALCLEHGIRPSFNLMLFDPETTLADVAANIEFSAETLPLQWNLCRTEVYSGTPLLERLERDGRLDGDYRSYGYRISDPRAELMFRVMRVGFAERCFVHDSLMNRMIALSFARQVHERFFPGPATTKLAAAADALIVEVHRDTVDELRRTLEFAAGVDPDDERSIRDFAVEQGFAMTARAQPWYARFDELWGNLNARGATLFALAARSATEADDRATTSGSTAE